MALRFDNWKIVFMEQRVPGTLQVWAEPFVPLRVPKLFNLRTDPYERADITSNTYYDWLHRATPTSSWPRVHRHPVPRNLRRISARQKAASFTIDQALEKMEATLTSGH